MLLFFFLFFYNTIILSIYASNCLSLFPIYSLNCLSFLHVLIFLFSSSSSSSFHSVVRSLLSVPLSCRQSELVYIFFYVLFGLLVVCLMKKKPKRQNTAVQETRENVNIDCLRQSEHSSTLVRHEQR